MVARRAYSLSGNLVNSILFRVTKHMARSLSMRTKVPGLAPVTAAFSCCALLGCGAAEVKSVESLAPPLELFGFHVGAPLSDYLEMGEPEPNEEGLLWIEWSGNRLIGSNSLYFPSYNLISAQLWFADDVLDNAFLRVDVSGHQTGSPEDFALSCNGRISGLVTWLTADIGAPVDVYRGTIAEPPKAVWTNAASKIVLSGVSIPSAQICVAEIFFSGGTPLLRTSPFSELRSSG